MNSYEKMRFCQSLRVKPLGFIVLGAFIVLIIAFFLVPMIKVWNFNGFLDSLQNKETLNGSILTVAAKYDDSDSQLVNFNSSVSVHPGSNFKLFTAAAALHILSPDFKFKSSFYIKQNDLTKKNDLILRGSGDPTWTVNDIQKIANLISEYDFYDGDIYYDSRVFEGEEYGPGWDKEWEDDFFAVPIQGLQLNDNLLNVQGITNEDTGKFEINTSPLENFYILDNRSFKENPEDIEDPISAFINPLGLVIITGDTIEALPFKANATITNPSMFTASVLKQELVKLRFINPEASVRPFNGHDYGQLILEYESPPLRDIVFGMLKFSKNNYAETLIRTLGKDVKGVGSQEAGVKVLYSFLNDAGINPEQVTALDGSGLSPFTRASSDSIIQLFQFVDKQSWANDFWNAFPTAQEDGTLKGRFRNEQLDNKIIAKTGTHKNASSLSGRMMRDGRKDILFSIHVYNHAYSSAGAIIKIHPIIDRIVVVLGQQF